jgi:hypothetical protein
MEILDIILSLCVIFLAYSWYSSSIQYDNKQTKQPRLRRVKLNEMEDISEMIEETEEDFNYGSSKQFNAKCNKSKAHRKSGEEIFKPYRNTCDKYYDERLVKPLVPEFEQLTVLENPTLQEVYDSHVTDYRKLIPHKNKLNGENVFKGEGAYNNLSFKPDTWAYENENEMNGGAIYNNVAGFDPLFDADASIFE